MKILICGDSYAVEDPAYPGLHWSEKILSTSADYEIINLAYGGCSNALIALQLMIGLRYQPDFIIFSFTNEGRYEFDNNTSVLPENLDKWELKSYIKDRYTTTSSYSMTDEQQTAYKIWIAESSQNLEQLKSYFYICFCLMTARSQNIKFCYSLGGFEYQKDYTAFLNQNFVKNLFSDFADHEVSTNLWYYGQKSEPCFHVDNEDALTLFANECMEKING